MSKKELFSVGEFAKLAQTTRDTLLYYDKIGLLSPVQRGDNRYRYYSNSQLAAVELIRVLHSLEIPLSEIKKLQTNRSPESLYLFLDQHMGKIDKEIDTWIQSRKLLSLLKDTIHSHLEIDENVINIKYMKAEAIFMGNLNNYEDGRDEYDALFDFYEKTREEFPDLHLDYPVWGMLSKERILNGDLLRPDRYYFYNPDGEDEKPSALYAIGYKRGGYGQGRDLYERILEYIDNNGFEVCGPAFEEYPLNEICVADENDYLMRVMITIREKINGENPNPTF